MAAIFDFKIAGLCAATFTPYTDDGRVDYDAVDAHAKDLAAHDVKSAFINGTTGDSMNLSDDERRKLGEAWMAASAKYGTVIMNHIGCNSITATCELAAHAEKIGCHAIAAMPPFFFKPRHAKDIAIWLKQVSDAAPRTPLYYYHFNAITGVFVDPLDIIKACEELGVPTFRGFKFTDYNLFTFANCLNYKEGKYDVLYARDEATLGGVATGARGHIGNAFNYAAGLYHRLRAAFASGDITAARLEQERANKLVLVMQDSKYGGQALAINRFMYELKGVRLGPPRLPLAPLTPEQKAALEADLRAIGYFEWCD